MIHWVLEEMMLQRRLWKSISDSLSSVEEEEEREFSFHQLEKL